MQRFNKKHNRKGALFTPLFAKSVLVIIGVVILFFIIKMIANRSQVIELRAEDAKNFLQSKKSMQTKIEELQAVVDSYEAKLSLISVLQDENAKLKAEFNRVVEDKGTIASVLTPPNRSFYDTLIIDAGEDQGIIVGQTAYAFEDVAIGTVTNVYNRTATIELFSAANKETIGTALGSDVAITLIGRGNGDFEVRIPRDVHFSIGDTISHQSLRAAVLAQIEKIVTDPRDPFQRLLAKVPINLTTVKWVFIR